MNKKPQAMTAAKLNWVLSEKLKNEPERAK